MAVSTKKRIWILPISKTHFRLIPKFLKTTNLLNLSENTMTCSANQVAQQSLHQCAFSDARWPTKDQERPSSCHLSVNGTQVECFQNSKDLQQQKKTKKQKPFMHLHRTPYALYAHHVQLNCVPVARVATSPLQRGFRTCTF